MRDETSRSAAPDVAVRVLYGEPLPADLATIVREELRTCSLTVVASPAREELIRLAAEATVLVVATARVDAALLAAAPDLRLVHHQGVGYDNVDLAACRQARVAVALTPEGTAIGVAEHTLLLILALAKHLTRLDAAVRAGQWPVWSYRARSFELAGKTLGLVGFGRIGREVARRARAFDARIVYFDPQPAPREVERALDATVLPLATLLRTADIVSLHLPATAQTRGLIGAPELALLQPHALLINTARGALVDEGALVAALTRRRFAGAGLDVLSREPPAPDHPLLHLDNVLLTPHVAAGSRDAFRTKMQAIAANIARLRAGEPLHNTVA